MQRHVFRTKIDREQGTSDERLIFALSVNISSLQDNLIFAIYTACSGNFYTFSLSEDIFAYAYAVEVILKDYPFKKKRERERERTKNIAYFNA